MDQYNAIKEHVDGAKTHLKTEAVEVPCSASLCRPFSRGTQWKNDFGVMGGSGSVTLLNLLTT